MKDLVIDPLRMSEEWLVAAHGAACAAECLGASDPLSASIALFRACFENAIVAAHLKGHTVNVEDTNARATHLMNAFLTIVPPGDTHMADALAVASLFGLSLALIMAGKGYEIGGGDEQGA